ncbi:hypothetical protein C5S32_02125 [ANME-1 cluster archaeon GoMg1]|nr:hypothetical protein [ANME-1 cluster archaeon GoMg1]
MENGSIRSRKRQITIAQDSLHRGIEERKVTTMSKIRPILAIIGIALLLFTAVLTMTSGIANAKPTATRTLPAESVSAGEPFIVRIEVSDYGIFGQVAETLPEGFIYLASTLGPRTVVQCGPTNTFKFQLLGETSFTYTVIAPDSEGTYTFSGILKDMNKNEYEVVGDMEIEIEEAEEEREPSVTRTLPEESVLAGESFTIEIEASHYGIHGHVVETLPEGFVYEDSTLNPESVAVEDNTVEFELWCEPSFTYTVTAPDTEGTHTFSGILIDEDKNEYEIGGDIEIAVKLAPGQFDTGSPANPYPSIFGTHTGIIIPSHTITVQKLYTYPCSGTGGHTESIELYENGTLIANGSWNGYEGDWHTITIHDVTDTPYVLLLKDHEYSYTICTGSYPQIIHAKEFNVTGGGGKITCSEFIDANGRRYVDWIPAIRLE